MASPTPKTSTYRLFWLNAAGRIGSAAQVIEAETDGEAVRQAEILARGRPVEIWVGTQRVAALNGGGQGY